MTRLGVALVMSVALLACRAAPPVVPVGGDFTLVDQNGARFASTSLRGSVALVFFGYTFCPDACPTTLSKLTQVHEALGDDGSRVKTVFVTVDPGRDTPAVLKRYLGLFALPTVGLTGSDAEIAAVAKQFAAGYEIDRSGGDENYIVNHTTRVYAIDPDGRTRFMFPYDATVDDIVAGVRDIL